MGNLERRNGTKSACAVCGLSDERTLSYTRLESGERITVCGSHKIAHRRADRLARTTDELRTMLTERRAS
ncbi:hypothetical protein AKJ09_00890 [Labilithrix luteola]|uniref:Uncharacterized protein n=2 Tax=Labilithrix luteola TaxID=1391654 RepID=A0A0K1PLG5_9BACT|nr:hypothetical protein AKJ09_00890 [Labilithrix luteola]